MLETNILLAASIVLLAATFAIIGEYLKGENLNKKHYGNNYKNHFKTANTKRNNNG